MPSVAKAPSLRAVLAENVRLIRVKRRLTQAQLGKKAMLSGRYVSLIEAGDRNVTVDTIEAVAKALDVSVVDLLTDGVTENAARTKQALKIVVRMLEDLHDKL
jgi:transcriptional regulator with XRE-family HTH domain